MPPKKPTVTKPAAKGTTATKTPSKGATKGGATGAGATKGGAAGTGASKGGAAGTGASKGGTTGGKTEEKKAEAKPIKEILVPEEIGLKEVANVMNQAGGVGIKFKESNRCLFMFDKNGNVGTFVKYRDVNFLVPTLPTDLNPEPMRKALMGSLRFGKPNVLDISGADQGGIMEKIKEKYDEIYKGLYNDIMDRSILEEDKYKKLYVPAIDEDVYKNMLEYNLSGFQFMILTKVDPDTEPNTTEDYMGDYFPVTIK